MAERGSNRAERTALLALAITGLLTTAKLFVWASTSSLAILSQAVDSALDLVALGLLFLAVRIGGRPADSSHHYGHAKAENLAAFAQTILLVVVVGGILVEALLRLGEDSTPVDAPWYALAMLAVSAIVDAWRIQLLRRVARSERSEALRAGALNFSTDIGTALVALSSLLFVRAGFLRADAIGGLIVSAAVLFAAWKFGKRSIDVLMDTAPDEPVDAIEAAATRATGVAETRRVRVRSGGKQLFADVTVAASRTSSLERAHDIAEAVEREIQEVVPGADVVVHVEPMSDKSGLVERALAAASRTAGVHEVHNVLIHAFNDAGRNKLRVTLHAKVEPGTSLREAHDLSEQIEKEVLEELGPDTRVDTHLEPLESTAFGSDVTAMRRDVVERVRQIATDEVEAVNCHEVLVTEAGGELSVIAHVGARPDLPLERIHAASQSIEKRVRTEVSEVGSIVIHFEPF